MDRDMWPFSAARDLRTQVVRRARVLQGAEGLVTSRAEWVTSESPLQATRSPVRTLQLHLQFGASRDGRICFREHPQPIVTA